MQSIPIESTDINTIREVYNFTRTIEGKELSSFNLIRFIVNPDSLSDLDRHEAKEYWYFAKGNGLLYINGNEVQAKEGEVYFFDSLVTHQVKNLSHETNLEILSIWW
ncbi:cupin domain-containing protein [Flavobacterium oreochromis]|uniref:Cupin domain-containing protein n=1 Tax=Flavobacterium oreochromis TaxID=2906078 RepID=A0ABW8P938_9FLAO|nr:cupin domain-containing protein [Flavobacterium oreochromis]